MGPEEYYAIREENREKYAEFMAWLEKNIARGVDYAVFTSASATNKQFKAVRRELRKLSLS